ncbi:hypothetical protein [Paenibacillus sp. PastF-3]|uniref:hypothetical protein n=1 Tax=Paenibacillus sp. PastF-3 TaxID=2940626 RepID=UPI002474B17A|nr:hypothetical protein [Paenibacillus sp. PastF-3]
MRTGEEKPGWFVGAKASIGSASQSARKGCIPLGASNSLPSGRYFCEKSILAKVSKLKL